MEILLYFMAGFVLAAVGAYFVLRSVKASAAEAQEKALADAAKTAGAEMEAAKAKLQADLDNANANLQEAKNALREAREEAAKAVEKVKAEEKRNYQDMLNNQKQEQEKAQGTLKELHDEALKKMQAQLEVATHKMLEERQNEFATSSKEKIDAVIKPLQQDIDQMRKSVQENSKEQVELKAEVRSKIEGLIAQTERASQSADELTLALKNSHKIQGDWGERKLVELLSSYGFVEGRHILSQEYIKDEYGRLIVDDKGGKKRTDVILRLDEKRVIVIDSKTSLDAYLGYIEAQEKNDTLAMQKAIEANLESIKGQIELLRKADYSALIQEPYQTIGYTVMYVPVSGALQLAMANCPSLWHEAMEKDHILLCDDRMLETIIRTIEITWTKIDQLNNQKKIIEAAERVIERVEILSEHFINAEEAVNEAQERMSACRKQLTNGGSSILTAANELKKLGVKPTPTQAKLKRRKKIAPLLEELGEEVNYEEVNTPAIEEGEA